MKIGRDVNKMGVREYDYIRGNTALAPERKVKELDKKRKIEIKNPIHNLAVGSIQIFLDKYLEKFGGNLDYIHGEEETIKLSKNGKIGIILDTIKKSDLFKTIILQGALPRKSFSMGEASEKRYYLECKKIK